MALWGVALPAAIGTVVYLAIQSFRVTDWTRDEGFLILLWIFVEWPILAGLAVITSVLLLAQRRLGRRGMLVRGIVVWMASVAAAEYLHMVVG